MATLKSLQRPQIIDITASVVRVAHPDLTLNISTQLRAELSAGATTAVVGDNNGFIDDDYALIGRPGDNITETTQVDAAVTRGQNLTITNNTKFTHESQAPFTKIYERQITLYGASSDGGSLTAIRGTGSAVDIEWNKPHTEIPINTGDTAYAYYVVKFYDGTTESAASSYIPATGLPDNSAEKILQQALIISNSGRLDDLITRKDCVNWVNKAQEEVRFFTFQDPISGRLTQKDWNFEEYEDESSLTVTVNDNQVDLSDLTYPLKRDSGRAIISLRIGSTRPIDKIQPKDMKFELAGTVRTTVSGSAANAGDTTLNVASNVELPEEGTVYLGSDVITYTGKSGTTQLTGVPSTGTGAITTTHSIGTAVWYGVTPDFPTKYTVDKGKIIFNKPFSSTYENYNIKLEYFREIPRITQACDNTEVDHYDIMYFSVAEKIEKRKGNLEKAAQFKKDFTDDLLERAVSNEVPTPDTYRYYEFEDPN